MLHIVSGSIMTLFSKDKLRWTELQSDETADDHGWRGHCPVCARFEHLHRAKVYVITDGVLCLADGTTNASEGWDHRVKRVMTDH